MGIDLYPSICHEVDLSPDSFGEDVDAICNEIHDACKGFGTDEERLLKVMGGTDAETRAKVPLRYEQLYGKILKDVMESECGRREFGVELQLLAQSPVEMDCDLIRRASKGMGTKELLLISIICGRSNMEMEILKKKYFDLYTEDLGRKLDAELGGALEQLVFNVLQAAEEEYDPDYHTEEKMEEDAKKLYKEGQGKRGTDEAGMFKILCASPPQYLKKLNLLYADKYGYTLFKALETELNGNVQDAALFLLGMKLKPYEEVAKLINRACKGMGTNELLLMSALIRYQSIMKDVMLAHVELYGKTVEERVKSESKGESEKLLLEILKQAE